MESEAAYQNLDHLATTPTTRPFVDPFYVPVPPREVNERPPSSRKVLWALMVLGICCLIGIGAFAKLQDSQVVGDVSDAAVEETTRTPSAEVRALYDQVMAELQDSRSVEVVGEVTADSDVAVEESTLTPSAEVRAQYDQAMAELLEFQRTQSSEVVTEVEDSQLTPSAEVRSQYDQVMAELQRAQAIEVVGDVTADSDVAVEEWTLTPPLDVRAQYDQAMAELLESWAARETMETVPIPAVEDTTRSRSIVPTPTSVPTAPTAPTPSADARTERDQAIAELLELTQAYYSKDPSTSDDPEARISHGDVKSWLQQQMHNAGSAAMRLMWQRLVDTLEEAPQQDATDSDLATDSAEPPSDFDPREFVSEPTSHPIRDVDDPVSHPLLDLEDDTPMPPPISPPVDTSYSLPPLVDSDDATTSSIPSFRDVLVAEGLREVFGGTGSQDRTWAEFFSGIAARIADHYATQR